MKQLKGLSSVSSRCQALQLLFDTTIVVAIKIVYEPGNEVLHGIKLLQIQQLCFGQAKEVFHCGVVQTVALAAYVLDHALFLSLEYGSLP